MNFSITDCFMIAFVAGLIFGLVYEALRIVRLIVRFRWAVMLCDILFFVLAAEVVLKISEFLGSYIRTYTVLGFGAGIFAYIFTFGRLFNIAESAASVVWRKTIGRFFHKLGGYMHNFFGSIIQKSRSKFGKATEYLKNKHEKHSKVLQLPAKKMYNNKRLDKIGESEKVHVIKATVRRGS